VGFPHGIFTFAFCLLTTINRAILLTPPGVAAIAVVRLLGPLVDEFLARHFSRIVGEARAVHGEFRMGDGGTLDDPVIVRTGGGGADVNLHGGAWIVRTFLEMVRREGFEVEERARVPVALEAVEGQTLIEREISAYLPLAQTELGVRVLIAQPEAWERLSRLTPEEALVEKERMRGDLSLHYLLHPPHVAIVGAPNVGKSTLANRLFAREQVITADMPGTTRDWVGETANLDGLAITLVDTPGVRQTEDAIEAAAIAGSVEQIRGADLVVVVLDATRPIEGDQVEVLAAWPGAMRVVNKCDLQGVWSTEEVAGLGSAGEFGVPIKSCGRSGEGIVELIGAIRGYFGIDAGFEVDVARRWTERQWGLDWRSKAQTR